MAEATVTLKLTPAEFDLIRGAIRGAHERAKDVSLSGNTEIIIRNQNRTLAVQLADLIKKIG
jgi:hypothetical protein